MTPEQYAVSHQKAFRTAFNFLTGHFPPENTEEYWQKVALDSGNVSAECEEDTLTVQLVSGVINYLDRECKTRGDNNGTTVNN